MLALAIAGSFAPGTAVAVNYGIKKSLPMQAVVVSSPVAGLRLEWVARSDVASYELVRENPDGSLEAPLVLPGSATSHLDTSIVQGLAYEWRMEATLSDNSKAYGFLRGGIDVALVEDRGRVLVCVAEAAAAALAPELDRLKQDLRGDGWRPKQVTVLAAHGVADLKATILTEHSADPLACVFLFGDLPVPYSGSIFPDGHTNHRGAWPADLYYAEIDGIWTDSWRVMTSASSSRNHNLIGDGKFDQSNPPSDVDLMLGRVDLSELPAFAPQTEIDLLRQYLDKDHAFRHAALAVPGQALVDDHLSHLTEGVAVTARAGFAAALGHAAVSAGDWPDEAGGASYLMGYGAGYGSYVTLSGVGSTASFAAGDPQVVFSLFFGSYFGDWDVADNFLRAPLACSGVALASAYSGRPQWQPHLLGLGAPLGEVARASQNASSLNPYYTSYYSRQIHVALHGDPTLRLFPRPPATSASALRNAGGAGLSWTAPTPGGELLGYHVYRSPATGGSATRLNTNLLAATSFTDPTPPAAGAEYQVRAIYRETTGSGSFINSAQAAFAALPPLPEVAIDPPVLSAGEGGAAVVVTVSRSGELSAPLEVSLGYSGTASPVDDVSGAAPLVTIPAGSAQTQIAISATADGIEEGAEELVVALDTSGGGYLAAGGGGGTCLTIYDSAYSVFAEQWFGHQAVDPDVAGELADPDADGLGNLLEFLVGSSPLEAGVSPLQALPDEELGGVMYRKFEYTRVLAASSLSDRVEISTDLVGWSEPAGAIVSVAPEGADAERVTVWIPNSAGAPRTFVRLAVDSP